MMIFGGVKKAYRMRRSASKRPLSHRRKLRNAVVSPATVFCFLRATLHLYIRFVTAPGTADGPSVEIPALFKLRNVTLHPTKNCRMCQGNASLAHHLRS